MLPEALPLRQQLAEDDVQHRACGEAEGNRQQQGIHGPHAVAQQRAQDHRQSAEGGHGHGPAGLGAPHQQGGGDAHALGDVVQADDQGGQRAAVPGRAGEGGSDSHAHGHVVEGHQPRRVECVVAAGA